MTPEERKDWEHDGDLALLRDENDKLRWEIARLQVLLADALSDLDREYRRRAQSRASKQGAI